MVNCNLVEYLATNSGKDTLTDEKIIALTFRLNEGSFKPSNLILSLKQAKRLLKELSESIEKANEHTTYS